MTASLPEISLSLFSFFLLSFFLPLIFPFFSQYRLQACLFQDADMILLAVSIKPKINKQTNPTKPENKPCMKQFSAGWCSSWFSADAWFSGDEIQAFSGHLVRNARNLPAGGHVPQLHPAFMLLWQIHWFPWLCLCSCISWDLKVAL